MRVRYLAHYGNKNLVLQQCEFGENVFVMKIYQNVNLNGFI